MNISKTFVKLILVIIIITTAVIPQAIKQTVNNPNQIPAVLPSCIIQDSYGFVWIGDQEGLIRYDGYTLQRYKTIPFDSTSLSSNFIKDIKEDNKGNLWITTHGGGLNYFDQLTGEFTHYLHNTKSPASLGSNTLTRILVNDDGSLWIGTQDNGFTFVDWDSTGNPIYTQYTEHNLPPDIPIYTILELYKDKNGFLWIGSIGMGLQRLNPKNGEFKTYKHDPHNPESLSHNCVSFICEDNSGNLWIGTGSPIIEDGAGLNMFNPKTEKFTRYKHDPANPNSLNSNIIKSLKIDRDNGLWIGTSRKNLQYISIQELYKNKSPKFKNTDSQSVEDIYEDCLGNIWVAPKTFYVKKYDYQQNQFYFLKHKPGNPNSLSHNTGFSLCLDKAQNLWVGHTQRGVTKYNLKTKRFKHYSHNPDNINSLCGNTITSICEDKKGDIWIGTATQGISILNTENESFKHIKANELDTTALYSNYIRWIIKRTNGDLWIAHNKLGLQLYDAEHKRFKRIDIDPNTTEDEAIYAIFEDREEKLWVGTVNNGLYGIILKNRKIESVDHFKYNSKDTLSLTSNVISYIIEDNKKKVLWITTDCGLNRLDIKTGIIKHITTDDGLPTNFLLNIIQDNSGELWITSPNSIIRYNPITKKIINYEGADGLPHTRFGGQTKRTAKSPDGRLFFAAGGVTFFNPEQIIDNPNVPPIRLTDFNIFHESAYLDSAIQFKKKIILNYKQNVFSLGFTALDFTNPSKNEYAYKLEGFNDDWIYIGKEHTAHFTNLDPGEYIFRVKGSNNHGIWNEEGTSVKIIITPPWWKTIFAYCIYFLLLITGIIYWRINDKKKQRNKTEEKIQKEKEKAKLRETELRAVAAELQAKAAEHQARAMEAQTEIEKEQMRSRIASDLHDEIGSNLSSIALISQTLQKKFKPETKDLNHLKNINRIAKITADSMRDIIWFINPENESFQRLIIKMRETANIMLGEINFIFKSPTTEFAFEPDLNFKRNLYLVYKEILQNIIKHSQASKVEINISASGSFCILQVTDNGVGFDLNNNNAGNGLKNIKNRATQIECEFEINSAPGKGTSIKISKEIP